MPRKAIWIAMFGEAAAAGAGVQAAAALYREPVSQITRRWAPELELATEPDLEFPREAVHERYRSAGQIHFAKTAEVKFGIVIDFCGSFKRVI